MGSADEADSTSENACREVTRLVAQKEKQNSLSPWAPSASPLPGYLLPSSAGSLFIQRLI